MTDSAFEVLREKRLRYVDSARDNDFEDGLRTLLADLYPDNAHFIYELLQNAEDARATLVRFELEPNQLVVTHNGARTFDIGDVESITSIGKSTKRDDATQIGKFGVGFKAVFAYTSTPEIHSDAYSFAIRDLFVPDRLKSRAEPGHTTFVFPFDRPEKPTRKAFDEVARGLKELVGTSVLFLSNVRSIEYQIMGFGHGAISRNEVNDSEVSITEDADGVCTVSRWIRLDGHPEPDELAHLTVSAAFLIEQDESKGGKVRARARVSSVPEGATCIYFPAAKENSGLKFHIHAPFASTVARDGVRDTPENLALIEAIGELVASALPGLRDRGLLDDGLLAALPNRDDPLSGPYAAIRDRITQAFEQQPLTPTIGGGFEPSIDLVRSPSPIRGAFIDSDLALLTSILDSGYPESPRWIPDREGRAGRFLAGLRAYPFGWGELEEVFELLGEDSAALASWTAWLKDKTLAQHRDFLELLGLGFEIDEFPQYGSNLSRFRGPLLWVNSEGGTELRSAAEAHLPIDPDDSTDGRVVTELAYFDNESPTKSESRLAGFYKAMRVVRWNERAAIEQRLRTYRNEEWPSDKQHLTDLRSFIAHLRANPSDKDLFSRTMFILTEDTRGEILWASPDSVVIDEPYRSTGLSVLFAKDDDKSKLWAGYKGRVAGIDEFAETVGAMAELKIVPAYIHANPEMKGKRWWDGRSSHLGTESDWQVEHLDSMLTSQDPRLLKLLWDLCCENPGRFANAIYQRNAQAEKFVMRSQLAIKLGDEAWIPDSRGELRAPAAMTVEELPKGWSPPAPKSLAVALGFGAEELARDRVAGERARQAEELGVSLELVELLGETPLEYQAELVRELRARSHLSEDFPVSVSANPERRSEMVKADAVMAPEFKTSVRSRSVVEGKNETTELSKQYLRGEYTSDRGVMFCQACHEPVPFTVNGLGYFEAIQFVRKRAKTHHQNRLALCPLCAAMYQQVRGTDDEGLLASIVEQSLEPDAGRVPLPILLNDKRVEIWFTGRHMIDLKAALGAAGKERF